MGAGGRGAWGGGRPGPPMGMGGLGGTCGGCGGGRAACTCTHAALDAKDPPSCGMPGDMRAAHDTRLRRLAMETSAQVDGHVVSQLCRPWRS